METKNTSKWVAQYGMLVALAFLFSYIEAIIPIPVPIPGIKLGLANLVTIVGLYTVGVRGTVVVSLIRVVLVGLTFGNLYSMIYGLCGAILSLLMMIMAKKLKWFSTVGVSIIGGIGHNVGQLIVAAYVVQTMGVFYYLPWLLVAGVIAGSVIGLMGGIIVQKMKVVIK